MFDGNFHFAHPWWLLGLLAVPLLAVWLRRTAPVKRKGLEDRYADAHLLPYLTAENSNEPETRSDVFLAWSLAWTLLILAMAAPRWDFERVSAFKPAADLVVLLDISASMDIQDVRPSRLARARQEIQDLLRVNPGIRIGLIAFATVAHVISPVTDDMQTLKRVLPNLSTDLVRLPGSRLGNALDKAGLLLASASGETSRHILLISDGDFDEPGLMDKIGQLTLGGIRLHVLGVGTEGGGPVPYLTAPGGRPIVSRLDPEELQHIARQGHGLFSIASYEEKDVQAVINAIIDEASKRKLQDLPSQIWNERFYIPLFPALLLILYLFGPQRRHARRAG